VAALYFFEDAGRGGYGGFLVSDGDNDWLAGPWLKMLIGYPVENVPEESRGRMHRVVPDSYFFEAVDHQVYRTFEIKSYPGNNGGPLCVRATNSLGQLFFFPAAVCLQSFGSGIVRAIDLDVVDLIRRAERSGNGGRNGTGGGLITIVPTHADDPHLSPGSFQVHLGPPVALRLGGAWRLSPTNAGGLPDLASLTNYSTDTRSFSVGGTNLTLEIRELPGFLSPTNQTIEVPDGATVRLTLAYSVVPPRLIYDLSSGVGISGTPGTRYQLEVSPRPTVSDAWSSMATMTLGEGINWLSATTSVHFTNCFYRAFWISE